jgi:hypothetical protein
MLLLKAHILFMQVDCIAEVQEVWIVTDIAFAITCDKHYANMQVFFQYRPERVMLQKPDLGG